MAGDGSSAADAAACERPLFEVFAAIAALQPDHIAVDDGAARLTYAELHDRALRLGARIAALVPEDALVGVLVPTSIDTPVAWLACLAARRPFLPLDAQLPPGRNQAIADEAGLAAVIVPNPGDDVLAWLPATVTRVPLAPDSGHAATPLPPGLPPAKVGMVLFTSGSTGRPKGIALHERSQLRKALNYRVGCGLGRDDRLLSLHPPSTNGGAGDVLGALLCGATLHLIELKRHGLGPTLALLRNGGITVCATVPVVARTLMTMDGAAEAFRRLRILRLGGDTVLGSDVAALAHLLPPSARILVRFGMTESGATIAQRLLDPREPVEPGPLALDTAVPGKTISVLDADGNLVRPIGPARPNPGLTEPISADLGSPERWETPPSATEPPDLYPGSRHRPQPRPAARPSGEFGSPELHPRRHNGHEFEQRDRAPGRRDARTVAPGSSTTGELLIHGRYVALGRWAGGKLDTAAFPADPAAPDIRTVRTGDLVTLRPDGMLIPIGRVDRQVKINGMRVEPGDTEAALRGLPGVADAVVMMHDDAAAPALVACVVLSPRQSVPSARRRKADDPLRALRAQLATLLPAQQVPVRIVAVPAIPLLPSLKPDLAALREALAAANLRRARASIWPRLRNMGPLSFASAVQWAARHYKSVS